MSIIFNAGSENKGGTLEQAKKHAKEWIELLNNKLKELR